MKVIYIAGAYLAPRRPWWKRLLRPDYAIIEGNIQKAKEAAMYLWAGGWTVICPHLNTAHFDGIAPDKHFLKGYMELLKRCDAIYMLAGWWKSAGAMEEYNAAKAWGMEIYYQTGEHNGPEITKRA